MTLNVNAFTQLKFIYQNVEKKNWNVGCVKKIFRMKTHVKFMNAVNAGKESRI